MPSPIRVNIAVGTEGALTPVETLANEIAKNLTAAGASFGTAMASGLERTASGLEKLLGGVNSINTALGKMEAILERVAQRSATLRGGAGGASPAGAGGIQEYVAAQLNNFASRGFQQVGSRVTGGPGGVNQTTAIMRDAEGAIGRINLETGKWSQNLETAKSRWSGLASAISGGFGTIHSIGLEFASWIYTFERIGSGIKNYFVNPFIEGLEKIQNATEESRKFEYAISGAIGGLSRARELNQAIVQESRTSPLSVNDLRSGARALALTPSLASQLAFGSPTEAAGQAGNFASLSARLADLNPAVDSDQVQAALRAALAGDINQLRRRLGIQPQALASLVGTQPSQLNSNPTLTLEAINKYADIFIPQSSLDLTSNLITTRVQKLKDAFDFALTKVGNSGVFDSTGGRIKHLSDQLFSYFSSGEFDAQATRMSSDLDRIIGNVSHSVERLLNAITGKPSDVSTVAGAVDSVGNLLDHLADLSGNLPNIATKIGPAVESLASKLGQFVDAVVSLASAANDPQAYVGKIVNSPKTPQGGNANAATIRLLSQYGFSPSDIGSSSYDAGVSSDAVYGAGGKLGRGFIGNTSAAVQDDLHAMIFGKASPTSTLDFSKLGNSSDQLLANRVYSEIIGSGNVSPDTLAMLNGRGSGGTGSPTTRPSVLPSRADEPEYADLYRRLIHQEYSAPNFAAILAQGEAGNAGLGALAERQQSPLDKLAQSSNQVFGNVSTGKNTSLTFAQWISQINGQFATTDNLLNQAISQGQLELKAGIPGVQQGGIDSLIKQRTGVEQGFNIAMDSLREGKEDAVKQYSNALENAIKDLPPEARAVFQKQIINGTTELANTFVGLFGVSAGGRFNELGLGSQPIDKQLKTFQEFVSTGLAISDAQKKYGDISSLGPNASFSQIMSLKRLDPRQAAQSQLAFLQGPASTQLNGILQSAQGRLAENPNDQQAMADLIHAEAEVGQLNSQIITLQHGLDDAGLAFEKFAESARGSLESTLGTAISNLIQGTGNLRDVFASLAKDIINDFSQMASHNIIQSLIGNLGQAGQGPGGQGPGVGSGIFGALLGKLVSPLYAGGGAAATPPGVFTAGAGGAPGAWNLGPVFGAANGGIFPGSFMPFHAFSSGGIVSSPTMGLIGEGGLREAVIPLPNGRSIQGQFKDGGNSPQVNIAVFTDLDRALASRADQVFDGVTGQIYKKGSKLNKAVRAASGN